LAVVLQEIIQDKIYLDLEGNVQTRPAEAFDGEAQPYGTPGATADE
jgi:hypothetical protein